MNEPDKILHRYGTLERRARMNRLSVGPLSLTYGQEGIRKVIWKDVEILRGISAPLRDENWGTISPDQVTENLQQTPTSCQLERQYSYLDNALGARLEFSASSCGRLDCTFHLKARADVMLNRAGFTILHPVKGVAGHHVDVRHASGTCERLTFPDLISPVQPVLYIAGLSHQIGPARVSFEFEGDVFEMEDQRNWSDASFKTYCRPLKEPFPFKLCKGETIRQVVRLRMSDADGDPIDASRTHHRHAAKPSGARTLPDILIAAQAGWPRFRDQPASGYVVRIGQDHECSKEFLHALAMTAHRVGAYIDAELILESGPGAARQMAGIAALLTEAGIAPRHVTALPRAYLKSHQPDGPWPDGLTPDESASLAGDIFPDAEIGTGSLTNFTELNRCRPSPGSGDYITHGNAAIVHAADDLSVLETLEALPWIFESGRVIAGGRARRLGLFSIGMRGNPYGESLAKNPENIRKTMTDDDPRQKGLFAAAYAIGVVTQALEAGVEAITLAGLGGPFGTHDRKSLFPVFHVVKALSALSGRRAEPLTAVPDGVFGFRFKGGLVAANCSPVPVSLSGIPTEYAVLDTAQFEAAAHDPDWLENTAGQQGTNLALTPFACVFAGTEADQ